MSITQPTTGVIGKARELVIRNGLSRGLSRLYSWFGFVNRQELTRQFRTLGPQVDNQALILDRLVERGVLKTRFRKEIGSLDEVRAFMLRGTTNIGRLSELEGINEQLDANALIANRIFSTLIPRGYYSVCHYMNTNEPLAAIFSSGIKYAATVGKTLGLPAGALGLAWFVGGLPAITPGLVMAGLTATCVMATKLGNILPQHGLYGKIGAASRFVSRKVSPFVYSAGGGYLGYLAYHSNLNIPNMFDAIGLEGTTMFLGGLIFAIQHYVKNKASGFDKAHGGMLDPGDKKVMKKLISSAAYSSAAEVHYIGTRLLLLGGATAYMCANIFSSLGIVGFIPLSLPVLGIAAAVGLRGKNDYHFADNKSAGRSDWWKMYSPFVGLAAGGVASVALGGIAAASTGLLSLAFFSPIAYTIFLGSFATLFLNELHGSFHSLNTNIGWMNSLQTSSRDLMGEQEMKTFLKEHSRILAINPHTGLHEHTLGLLFSALLNRKPGLSFVCMYDLILSQLNNTGKLPNLENHRLEKEFIAYVRDHQSKVFDQLHNNILNKSTAVKYTQLAANLRDLADYFDTTLRDALLKYSQQGKPRFFHINEIAEVRRAVFQQFGIRAEEFRKIAGRLERQAAKGQISETDFMLQWSELLNCYDPEMVKIIAVARKNLSGDERKVRKVENVATGLILRGVTAYKGWGKEVATDRHPPEDWIGGTWTQVPNPDFSYKAKEGTLEGAKFIWVKVEHVLTKLQERNREFLSSSKEVEAVDNLPSTSEGFVAGNKKLKILVNGGPVEIAEYFYVDTTNHRSQEIIPSVKDIFYRSDYNSLRANYQIATWNHTEDADMKPYVLMPPAFDYSIMMDKNDVQVKTPFMPSFLKRAARDKYIHLVRRYPLKGLFWKEQYRFANPFPNKDIDQSQGLRVVDANIELSHSVAGGQEYIIPFKIDRGAAHVGVNEAARWQSMKSATVTMIAGKVAGFSLTYGQFIAENKFTDTKVVSVKMPAGSSLLFITYTDGKIITVNIPPGVASNTTKDDISFNFELSPDLKQIWVSSNLVMPMPPRDWPQYLTSLNLPGDGDITLGLNNFSEAPHREGDVSWVKIAYADGAFGFARTADGKRPLLNNKDLHVNPTPSYYQIHVSEDKKTISITDVCVQRGYSIFIPRGWDRGLEEGEKLAPKGIDTAGNIYIVDNQLTPIAPTGQTATNYKGQMIGVVNGYDAEGKLIGEKHQQIIPLGNYVVKDRPEHLQSIVEIVPTPGKEGKLTVVTRRMDTKGLTEDSSKYVYTMTGGGAKKLEDSILDLSWIRNVRVTPSGVVVTYETPESHVQKTLVLPAAAFRDNDGVELLANKKARVSKTDDIYQSHDGQGKAYYTDETERFSPAIDTYNGNLRLVVHKVDRRDISIPKGVKLSAKGTVKIFPAAADTLAKLKNGSYIPLALAEPLTHLDQLDYHFSQVNEGKIKQVIGPQTRFGENDNISSEYVRDPYFYGLTITALFSTIERYGENFAINRSKAIRAFRGIQSGRTHIMPWQLLYNEMADVLETNSQYYKKLSNFAEEIWGPGVSEDTQMEMAYWLKGIKMWVVKEMVALMAAEKKWGNYNVQNTQRYNYSEVLFNLSFLLSKIDIIQGRFLGRQPVMMNWGEMSEISAGKTWYKVPFAKVAELLAIPSYLMSFGHILFYPVDLVYFIGAWLGRTAASSINYTKHLISLGYGFLTGLWKNPGLEFTFLHGYFKGAVSQFLKRFQYGTFMLTVGGTDDTILEANRKLITKFAVGTGASLAITTAGMIFGGLASWLILPFGLAAIPVGFATLAKGLNHYKGVKRYAMAVGGAALTSAGILLTIAGAPALANFLSIALVTNLTFGIYQAGLLLRGLSEIKRAKREGPIFDKPESNQKPLDPNINNRLTAVTNTINANKLNLSFQQMHEQREELRRILREIDIMDDKGRVIQGIEHPYRLQAFNILDVYAELEMAMCVKAVRELNANPNSQEAKTVLIDLLQESKEYLVIDYAAKAYRKFGFHLPVSMKEYFSRFTRIFTK